MAITRDALLGTSQVFSAATTGTLTTVAAAAANTWILVAIGGTQDVSSVDDDDAGTAYIWAKIGSTATDKYGNKFSIWGTYAHAGLASGKIITATYAASSNWRMLAGVSYLGLASASATDVTAQSSPAGAEHTSWSGAAVATTNADDLIFGLAETGGMGEPTSTPGGSYVEAHDWALVGGGIRVTTVELVVASTGTYTPIGTWATSQTDAHAYITISLKAAVDFAPVLRNTVYLSAG